MISSSHLSKVLFFIIFFVFFAFHHSVGEEEQPADIWKKVQEENRQNNQNSTEKDIKVKSPTLSDGVEKIVIKIDESEIEARTKSVIGIFDPEENNFNLDMWTNTDGEEIKKVLARIGKLKLPKLSEELLFQVLFTNAYSPKKNLDSEEFLKIKINWLIKNRRIKNLENLLKTNPEVGQNSKAIKFLINEYLSSTDIESACDKVKFIDKKVQNNYLEKFTIYCLIHNDQKDEAQLIFDLLREGGYKNKFFEDKINFLLGINEKTTQKILDDNLLNFYLSHITSERFIYQPNDKTDKYIWKYLSSANLVQINTLKNEDILLKYELAAAQNSFDSDEIFKIYLQMNFNFNQLVNAGEIYKNLPNYKARALIYQSMILSDSNERKISLAFLLKDLFEKDKLLEVYKYELSDILKSIDLEEISEDYVELIKQNLEKNRADNKIKFDNDILHRSKVIKHFLDNNEKLKRTEKDFKSVYKKIKKNKKYFISIKDIVVLESLKADGVKLPKDLNYTALSSQLTVPKNLQELAKQNQIGLVMLKIIEIIGEDNINDLDPETVYFLNKILNELNLKKIRNNILSQALPVRV